MSGSYVRFIALILLTLCAGVRLDQCNFHATLVEKETFYLTQPISKTIAIDLTEYFEAFPQLDNLTENFEQNLETYSDIDSIKGTEPVQLIPFNDDFNAYSIKEITYGKNAFNACAVNGGSPIQLDEQNRGKVVEILNEIGMEKTPVHMLPFYSLLSLSDLSPMITPEVDNIVELWTKSPPFLTKSNVIEYPVGKIDKPGEGNTVVKVSTTPEDYKSQVLCVKPNNPWDSESKRNQWLKLVPSLKTAIATLKRLKQSYDLSARYLKSMPKTVSKVPQWLKLVLPDAFREVLSFLDKYKLKRHWERAKSDATSKFHKFIQTSNRLARLFNLNAQSLTHMSYSKPRFSPPTILNINWRSHLGLNEEDYGLIEPIDIRPLSANVDNLNDSDLNNFKAEIKARIFHRQRDKITIYSALPNVLNGEMTTIKVVITNSQFRVAHTQEVSPLQCASPPAELHRVCHKLSFEAFKDVSFTSMTRCANALTSTGNSKEFTYCPKKDMVDSTYIYKAICGEDKTSTVVVNALEPLMLDFVCDKVRKSVKNITTFPSFIPTDCEVYMVDGTAQSLILPQWNEDLLQDPVVGDTLSPDVPDLPGMSHTLVVIISVVSSVGVVLVVMAIIITIRLIYKRIERKRNEKDYDISLSFRRPRHENPSFLPMPQSFELQFLD